MATPDLVASTRFGARSGFFTQAAVQVASIVGTSIVARILVPADFGVIAITTSLAGFVSLFASVGVGTNLVRRTSGVEDAAATYYWVLLAAGLTLVIALQALSAPLVRLVGQPQSEEALHVLAFCIPPALLTAVTQSILRWRLSWTRYNLTIWLPAMAFLIIQVSLALAGWGYWAVVAGLVFSAWLGLVLGHVSARWVPGLCFNWSHIRGDLAMTGSLWSQQFLSFVQRNVDYWAVSAFLGASALGQYYVAFVLPSVLRQRVTAVSQATLLAVLSRCSDDQVTFARIWSRTTVLQLFLGLPILAGLAAVAEPLVAVFFGSQWSQAATVVPWICAAAAVELYLSGTATAAAVVGLAGRLLAAAVIRTMAVAGATLYAAFETQSLRMVGIAVFAGTLFGAVAQEVLVARTLRLDRRSLWRELRSPVMMMSLLYGGVSGLLTMTHDWPPVAVLALAVPLGVLLYAALARLMAPELLRWAFRQARLTLGGAARETPTGGASGSSATGS